MTDNMTVSVPDELLERLRKSHPEINWSEIVRSAIIKKVERLERLTKRGEL